MKKAFVETIKNQEFHINYSHKLACSRKYLKNNLNNIKWKIYLLFTETSGAIKNVQF